MSQITLGKLTGIHPAQISQYENGHTAMPTVKLRKALKALGWDMRAVPLPEDP